MLSTMELRNKVKGFEITREEALKILRDIPGGTDTQTYRRILKIEE